MSGVQLSLADGGCDFHQIAILYPQGRRALVIDPEFVFRNQFIQIGVVLRHDVGMGRASSHDQLPGFQGLHKAETMQSRAFPEGWKPFRFLGRRFEFEPVFPVPENGLVA